ncbi:hypothetical protein [Actinomadura welshii]|uniref:hypothetical protein n=1 Tax=Actinomadura welshii TaxID=3103817 RepID=UPI0003ACED35|nr:hypothetical protein [Actinomadura madurae]
MPVHDEAVATALDAYQHQLLPDDLPSHRTDPLVAELLSKSLLGQLVHYADRRDLNVRDTVALLHQDQLDRGNPGEPAHGFRLGSEVQFRQQRTASGAKPRYPLWRGFITALAGSPDGEARCTVRVPGVNQGLHVTASELEPADPLPPLPTRTAGVVASARDAEATIIDIAVRLKNAANNGLVADEQALTDLAQLTMRLGKWSGGRPDAIMHHLHDRVLDVAQRTAQEHSGRAAARLSATEFPQGPTPDPCDDPPPSTKPKPDNRQKPRKRHP